MKYFLQIISQIEHLNNQEQKTKLPDKYLSQLKAFFSFAPENNKPKKYNNFQSNNVAHSLVSLNRLYA